jgi:hypothetical protein
MRTLATLLALLVSIASFCQQTPPAPNPEPAAQITGTFPAVLKVKVRTAALNNVSLAASVKRPTYIAPSAIAYGHSEFSTLPADLSFYAGLTERGNTGPKAHLDTLEARFEKGPRATWVLDVTQGEVLVGHDLARKLGLGSEKGTQEALPSFTMGAVTFSGVKGRIIPVADLPSESVDGVLPLAIFSGLGVHWEPSSGRITLYHVGSPDGPEEVPGAFAVPARCERGALLLSSVLQGKVGGYFLLNPGQPHSAIETSAARQAEVPMKVMGDVGKNQLVRGGLAEEARIRLGKTQVTIRSARVVDIAQQLPEGCLGILGRETFELFNYYLDPGACTVVLVPARPSGR